MGSVSEKLRTLFDKIWDLHVVEAETEDNPAILYIDLHLLHEVTSPQAFSELRQMGLNVRRPEKTLATMDHSIPTDPREIADLSSVSDKLAATQLRTLSRNCSDFRIPLFESGHEWNGIVHVIGPELGLTQPGMTIVCGDSHTSTHGAFGTLAFGIGTSEVAHVLASQCLLQYKPKTMLVRFDGRLSSCVRAKDIVLFLITQIGVDGGAGHVVEYSGSGINSLDMEERMTICNMTIELGARAGLIAPDDITLEYLSGRPFSPKGRSLEAAINKWHGVRSDDGVSYEREVSIAAETMVPMITFGTNPGMAIQIDGTIPDPLDVSTLEDRQALEDALIYMDLRPNEKLLGKKIDVVFIGSCTNGRISDLRDAANVLRGRKISDDIRMLVVPGSRQVKAQAEDEQLDEVFISAGAEWREPGCSMCIAMNGDELMPGQYAVSTTNRNFKGRQGKGGRTFLASPMTAAASAIFGAISDPRRVANC